MGLGAILSLAVLLPAAAGRESVPPGVLPESLGEAAWAEIEAGEVHVELREVAGNPVKEGKAVGLVAAPAERVFRVVTDNARFAEFMPYVRESTVKPGPEGSILNSQSLSLPLIDDRFYTIRVVNRQERADGVPVYRSTWTYVPGSGNVRENCGSWTVVPWGDGALVVYRVLSDPGGWVPRWAHHLASRRSLPALIEAVRARVADPRHDG
jgi:hypothetical protein